MQKRIWMRGIIIFWGVTLGYGVNEGLMVRYCEPGNPTPGEATAFRLDVPAGLIGTFCLDVTNTRREPITANILAVDGAVDANGLGTCGLDGEVEQFGKYVSDLPSPLTLAAGETRRILPHLQFPATMTGKRYGCIAYYDAGQLSGSLASVTMISRIAHVLWVTLTPPLYRSLTTQYPTDPLYQTTSMQPGYLHIAGGSGVVALELVNTGTIDQLVSAQCVLTVVGRGTKTYKTTATANVQAGKKKVLTCQLPVEGNLTLQAQAALSLTVSSTGIAPQPLIELPETYTVDRHLQVQRDRFFFPKELIAALIAGGLLLIVGISKMRGSKN